MLNSGIRFNDCFFSEPVWLAGWRPLRQAGLFVILSPDSNWAPRPFQPLYFGELGNNAPEASLPGNLEPGSTDRRTPLLVSVLPMPFSTTAQRRALRDELLQAYNPVSQTAAPPPAGGRLAAPAAPLPPRRRIGFLA